jgi:methionine-rich copper-binding protein CopC
MPRAFVRVSRSPELTLPIPRLSRRFVLPGLIALCLSPAGAQAHAILLASNPPAGGRVQAGAATLQFRFNSRIDPARSRLTLVWPDRSETVLKIDRGTDDEVLASHVDLIPGPCTIRWQVLAVDGHITRGEVAFTVAARR